MKITSVKVRKLFNDADPMKAIVSVTFDDQLALHDIKVIYAREKLFIVMPSRRNPDNTYRDIVHPINSDFRLQIEDTVLKAYNEALEAAAEQGEETAEASESSVSEHSVHEHDVSEYSTPQENE